MGTGRVPGNIWHCYDARAIMVTVRLPEHI